MRKYNDGWLIHDIVKKLSEEVNGTPIGVPSGGNQVEYAYGISDSLIVNIISDNIFSSLGLDANEHIIVDE